MITIMAHLPGFMRLVLPYIGEHQPDQPGDDGDKAGQIEQRDDGRPVQVETGCGSGRRWQVVGHGCHPLKLRSEEHTSELQSLMRISYAVFCLKKHTHTH